MRVIVLGAGVLGASAARQLARAGAQVRLIDQCSPGEGTSATTFSWTNANRKLDPDYFHLNTTSMAEHAKLAEELPGPPAYAHSGSVFFADAPSESWLTENVAQLRELGYPAHFVDRDVARQQAGAIRVPPSVTAVASFPSEGYVHPRRLVNNLITDATRHGAELTFGTVERIEEQDGVTVWLHGGEVLRGDRMVLAAGRWSEQLAATAGLSLPMVSGTERGSPIIGLLGTVTNPRIELRCVLHSPGLNMRPDLDGRTVIQALDLNPSIDPAEPVPEKVVETMSQRFAELTGASESDVGLEFQIGYRSLPADGLPVSGFLSSRARIYGLVTHSGITLAPLLGRLCAEELLGDSADPMLRAFRPDRLIGTPKSEIALARPTRLGEQ